MGEETLSDGGFLSFVPSSIFLLVAVLQLLDGFVARVKKREFRSSEEYQIRQEIKQLLKEATLLSTIKKPGYPSVTSNLPGCIKIFVLF